MTIAKITRAYTRLYHDSGQLVAYVEWVDHNGHIGRTEGTTACSGGDVAPTTVSHMGALFARAAREGVPIEHEVW
jgi:hypothetical protein